MEAYQDLKQGEKGAWVSIVAYLTLSALKVGVGYYAASKALTADGFNNVTDIVVSVAILIGLRIAQKPPDDNHRYGHFRAETVAAMIASFIMAAVGLQVLFSAGKALVLGESETPDMLAGYVAIFAAVCMLGVYAYNRNLARKIQNQALMAAAKDNLSDALVSIGAAVGIFGSQLGLPWLDPLTAGVVGIIICKTAWDIFRESSHTLTDGYDEEELERLKTIIQGIDGVYYAKDLKARVHGNQVLLDVVIEVDPYLNVMESHEITEEIEQKLQEIHSNIHVHIHIEPMSENV